MTVRGDRARGWLAGAACAALLVSGIATTGNMAQADETDRDTPAASANPEDSVEPSIAEEVTAQLEESGTTDFWVRFEDRPDLSEFAQVPGLGCGGHLQRVGQREQRTVV